MKTKVKKAKVVSSGCVLCDMWKPYYPWATYEAIHVTHASVVDPRTKQEEVPSELQPEPREATGKKRVSVPVNILSGGDADIPVELEDTTDKDVYRWCECLRDEHESRDEYLTVSGLVRYAFALRSRPYAEQCAVRDAIYRIYADERRRDEQRASEWEKRVRERQSESGGDSDAPSSPAAKRSKSERTETQQTETQQTENAPQKKRPGVIACILERLKKASKKRPVSKDEILAVLVKEFPERDKKAMASTISSQIPSGLLKEKGITVRSTPDKKGWWIPKEKVKE